MPLGKLVVNRDDVHLNDKYWQEQEGENDSVEINPVCREGPQPTHLHVEVKGESGDCTAH